MAKENNASVVRGHKNTDFTIMSNHHLRNMKLNLKAVGFMSNLLGLPDDWCYSIAGLVKICKEGETAVRSALHELIDEKYVYVEKLPSNYNKKADDYIAEDGLWHCGKCSTAKQFRMPEEFLKMGMPEIVGCCCTCQTAREKREKAEQQLANIISRNKELANIPEHYHSADIGTVESPDAKK